MLPKARLTAFMRINSFKNIGFLEKLTFDKIYTNIVIKVTEF